MSTWWLAICISKQYTSYNELKHRKVIAQGWPDLGNLLTLCPLVEAGEEDKFVQMVDTIERVIYGSSDNAPKVMWKLLNMKAGDLVVGIEGTIVKGICELKENGWTSYRYQSPEAYNYAQTIGFPIEWVDWDPRIFGFTPTAPAHAVPGIAGLQAESQQVVDAWKMHQNSRSNP